LNNQKILDDINLTILENEHLAIVGDSGSGKTTLAKEAFPSYEYFNFEDPKLHLGGLYLGRDSANCDLHIKDQSISRRHARIYKKGHEIWIEDLGSTNGIIVNGKSLIGGESALLNLQGTLAIGGIQLALGKD
jgi:hypothetical protein